MIGSSSVSAQAGAMSRREKKLSYPIFLVVVDKDGVMGGVLVVGKSNKWKLRDAIVSVKKVTNHWT